MKYENAACGRIFTSISRVIDIAEADSAPAGAKGERFGTGKDKRDPM